MANGWRPGTVPLTAADLPDVLAAHPVVVVHFWAPWNGVDRLFAPVLDSVRPEFEGLIEFRSADVDDEGLSGFCQECGVVNVPAIAGFAGGRRVRLIVGSLPAESLRAEFAALLGRQQTRAGAAAGGTPRWHPGTAWVACTEVLAGRATERPVWPLNSPPRRGHHGQAGLADEPPEQVRPVLGLDQFVHHPVPQLAGVAGRSQQRGRARLGANVQAAGLPSEADPAGHRLGVYAEHLGHGRAGLPVGHGLDRPLAPTLQLNRTTDRSGHAQLETASGQMERSQGWSQ